MIGKTFAHYRLVSELGAGGMGVVYKAEDQSLQRFVAVKVLRPEYTENATSRRHFLREARAAAAVKHPYIATIHDAGEQDGELFIVMEYVEGSTLRDILKSGTYPVRDVLHRRAALLGDHAEDVFTVLSFARDAFTSVLPDRLLDVPPSAVAAVIDGGIDAGLLVEVPGRPGFYRFAHNLVRHAFYDALPAARRAEIHLRVGQVLEEVVPRPLEIANQQGALSWELRAAISLAKLIGREGRSGEARALLAPILDRFTEGLDTQDPVIARQMLGK